jgi:hypothetical protein
LRVSFDRLVGADGNTSSQENPGVKLAGYRPAAHEKMWIKPGGRK